MENFRNKKNKIEIRTRQRSRRQDYLQARRENENEIIPRQVTETWNRDKGSKEKRSQGRQETNGEIVRSHRVEKNRPGWFSPPRAFRALCRWPDSRKDLICCSVLYISFGSLCSYILLFPFSLSLLLPSPGRENLSRCWE